MEIRLGVAMFAAAAVAAVALQWWRRGEQRGRRRPSVGGATAKTLMTRWSELCVRIGVAETAALQWWRRLEQLYDWESPPRFYHTLEHVASMCAEVDRCASEGTLQQCSVDRVLLATYFHDAIYNPRSPTNELDSANLFDEFVRCGRPAALADEDRLWVRHAILVSRRGSHNLVCTRRNSIEFLRAPALGEDLTQLSSHSCRRP